MFSTVIPAALALTGPLVAQSLITLWFSKGRGLAIGISAMGTFIGGLIFPVLSSELIVSSGWRQSLIVLAIIGSPLICVLGWWVLKKAPSLDDNVVVDGQQTSTEKSIQWTNKKIFQSFLFWIPMITFIPLIAAYGGVQFNLGSYMQSLQYDASQTAILISMVAVSSLIGKVAFGGLADMVDYRWLYIGAVICLCSALVLFQGQPDLLTIRIATFLLGIAGGAYIPLTGIISALFGVIAFSRVMGLFTMFITLAAFGPLFAGWIYDDSGSFDRVFTAFLFILISLSWLIVFLKVPVKNQELIQNYKKLKLE